MPGTAGSGKLFPVADPAFRLRRGAGVGMEMVLLIATIENGAHNPPFFCGRS
jgi:hypothetical protein